MPTFFFADPGRFALQNEAAGGGRISATKRWRIRPNSFVDRSDVIYGGRPICGGEPKAVFNYVAL